jgi:hypothetical protein
MAGQYRFKDSNGNIVAQISASVEGAIAFSGSVVDFTQANNVILGNVQLAGTASNALLLDGFDSQAFAFTSSIHPFTASIAGTNSFTSSTSARLNSIETITASNVSRLNSLEIKTGSLATTGSNVFIGTQTITGSLYISSDLVVQGSSSLQNITASAVSIGTNIVNLNTANPAIRYAGLSIGDSGSIGSSGSFLYDSVQDEMIFIHRGANTTVTSSVVLMGPQTYDNIGSETYPTLNIVQKGTGNEHLVDSCIFDNGTTTCIKNNLIGTGNINIGTSCIVDAHILNVNGDQASVNVGLVLRNTNATYPKVFGLTNVNNNLNLYDYTVNSQRLRIDTNGIACFSCQICTAGLQSSESLVIRKDASLDNRYIQLCNTQTGGYRWDLVTRSTAQGCGFGILNNTTSQYALLFDANNLTTFACKIGVAGASPTYPLTVYNGTNGTTAAFGGTTYGIRIDNDGTFSCNRSTIYGVDPSFYGSYQPLAIAASALYFNISGTDRVVLTNGGRIGLGVMAPEYPLHIFCCAPLGMKIQTCGSTFGSPSINLLNGGVDTVLTATNTGLEIGTWSANSLLFRTTQQSRLTIDSNGISTFSCNICAPAINTQTYLGVTKAGADGVGEGPYLVIAQPSQSKQWIQQLNASAGLDYWHYNGSAWSMPLKLTSAGSTCFACPISVPKVYQRPDDLTVTCNMTSFRSLNLAHQGAAGYIDINPVRLFGLPYQGGMFFIQITTWQRRYEYGIINWVDNGSNVPIIAVNYTTISCNPGANTPIQISATVPNPGSDNIIRIYICNMHSNGHGYSGMIYAVS